MNDLDADIEQALRRLVPRSLLLGAIRLARETLHRVDPHELNGGELRQLREFERELHAFRRLGEP